MLGTLDGKGDAAASDPVERESSKVQCVVAFYPAIDLAKIGAPEGSVAVTLATGIRPPAPNATTPQLAVREYQQVAHHPCELGRPAVPAHSRRCGHDRALSTIRDHGSRPAKGWCRRQNLIRVAGAGHSTGSAGWDKIDWSALALDWFETRLRQTNSSAAR
jgi:hypothetical protein